MVDKPTYIWGAPSCSKLLNNYAEIAHQNDWYLRDMELSFFASKVVAVHPVSLPRCATQGWWYSSITRPSHGKANDKQMVLIWPNGPWMFYCYSKLQMLHAWKIYDSLPAKSPSHVGNYNPSTKEHIGRRKSRSQSSDNMDRWKSRGGKSQKGEKKEWEEQRKSEKKEDAGARKGREVAIHCVFFPMICGSGGSKSRLAKAAGAEPCGQMRDVKLHAVVARSTCPSQKCKITDSLGPLLSVQMSFRMAGAMDCAPCQKWAKREDLVEISTATTTALQLQLQLQLHCTTLHCANYIALHYTPLHNTNYNYNYNYINNYTTLTTTTAITTTTTNNYTTLHYTSFHFTTLITRHYTTLHLTTMRWPNYTICNCISMIFPAINLQFYKSFNCPPCVPQDHLTV